MRDLPPVARCATAWLLALGPLVSMLPMAVVAQGEAGIEVGLNIVGFALDDEAVKAQMRGWAEANRGQFFDASDAAGPTEAVAAAVAAPVDVYRVDDGSTPVATTTVGAPGLELVPGEYWVEIRTDPVQVVRDIVLEPGQAFTLELGLPASE